MTHDFKAALQDIKLNGELAYEEQENIIIAALELAINAHGPKRATGWHCPDCGPVNPIDVTFDERHDERSGGCGLDVYWHDEQPQPETPND